MDQPSKPTTFMAIPTFKLPVKLKKAHKLSKLEKKSEGASGYDISTIERVRLNVGQTKLIHTGIYLEIPAGYEAQVRSRSGLATEGIFVLNSPGTIDSDYRGECCVILHNAGEDPVIFNEGDRIAQIVFAKVEHPEITVVEEINDTKRSEKGFGSTGV